MLYYCLTERYFHSLFWQQFIFIGSTESKVFLRFRLRMKYVIFSLLIIKYFVNYYDSKVFFYLTFDSGVEFTHFSNNKIFFIVYSVNVILSCCFSDSNILLMPSLTVRCFYALFWQHGIFYALFWTKEFLVVSFNRKLFIILALFWY